MKKLMTLAVVLAILAMGASMLSAQVPMDNTVRHYQAPQYFDNGIWILSSGFYLDGTNITCTVFTNSVSQGAITNALLTAGPYIGGNIPKAAISNAVVGAMWKNLPTSTNGLVSGQLWLNSNVLTIFP